jgi:hypothetical protein
MIAKRFGVAQGKGAQAWVEQAVKVCNTGLERSTSSRPQSGLPLTRSSLALDRAATPGLRAWSTCSSLSSRSAASTTRFVTAVTTAALA